MAGVYDYLKPSDRSLLTLVDAFGKHVVSGMPVMSEIVGTSSAFNVFGFHALGKGVWNQCLALYYDGTRIPSTDYQFYPGGTGQGFDTFHFTLFSVPDNAACISFKLPANIGNFGSKSAAYDPSKLVGIFECLKINDYNSVGGATGNSYSANPARVAAHILINRGNINNTRIDWVNWCAWRDFCAATETVDYATQPNDFTRGFGARGDFYNGTAFNTLVASRVDPVIDIQSTIGSPAIGVNTDSFSVRYQAKVKPKYSETYTFTIDHDDGIRFYIDGVLYIDQWVGGSGTHTFSTPLTAGAFYLIKLEWYDNTGSANLTLKWSSASQGLQVIPASALYPANVSQPRYETHVKFEAATKLDDALGTVLLNSASLKQDDGNVFKFYAYEQLTPILTVDESVITGEFTFSPADKRDRANPLQNRWSADFRDLESQYLEKADPVLTINRTAQQIALGKVVEGETIGFATMTRWQARKLLNLRIKINEAPVECEFSANYRAFALLNGDWITISHSLPGWTNKKNLILDAYDLSPEQSPNARRFRSIVMSDFDLISTLP